MASPAEGSSTGTVVMVNVHLVLRSGTRSSCSRIRVVMIPELCKSVDATTKNVSVVADVPMGGRTRSLSRYTQRRTISRHCCQVSFQLPRGEFLFGVSSSRTSTKEGRKLSWWVITGASNLAKE